MELKDIKSYLYKKYLKIIEDPVKISIVVAVLFTFIVLYNICVCHDYNHSDFWQGVRIEVCGMIFDLWIIGVLILFLNKQSERHGENQRYKDEIDDFRGWDSDEAKYRITGNIKRLNRNNVFDIDLSNCNLEDAALSGLNLSGSLFLGSYLANAQLWEVKLSGANLKGAKLWGANLNEANLEGALLYEARCDRAFFVKANFADANLEGADFKEANLTEAKNLTIEQLSHVKTLYLAKLEPELMEQVKWQYPHLLEKPE